MRCSQTTVSNKVKMVVDALSHPSIVRRFMIFKPEDCEWCTRRADEFARAGKFFSKWLSAKNRAK